MVEAMARAGHPLDKLAITYRAAVTLNAILNWLQHLGDTP